jgi:hypothetical protein
VGKKSVRKFSKKFREVDITPDFPPQLSNPIWEFLIAAQPAKIESPRNQSFAVSHTFSSSTTIAFPATPPWVTVAGPADSTLSSPAVLVHSHERPPVRNFGRSTLAIAYGLTMGGKRPPFYVFK